MTKSTKSEQLRIHLTALDALLIAEPSKGKRHPVALKQYVGEDRVHGETG